MNIIDAIKTSSSKKEICEKLNIPYNGRSTNKIKDAITENNLDVSHFKILQSNRKRKYELIKKHCPVCGKEFDAQKGHKREKTTCSYSCSNSFYRSGENNPNYIDGSAHESVYRKICFRHHKKECVVCCEKNIVEVHHYDGNHENNNIENLVPLCPTHHKYWHSRYRGLIKNKVDEYVKNYVVASKA